AGAKEIALKEELMKETIANSLKEAGTNAGGVMMNFNGGVPKEAGRCAAKGKEDILTTSAKTKEGAVEEETMIEYGKGTKPRFLTKF
ncbi:hypothetical protein NK983_29910, partial [Salmonella enterica subsp. enterica serovar Typhimurium]|nr:hypothetical protein [Salmonella enterica subsp. enterica serovar Typhimurium]